MMFISVCAVKTVGACFVVWLECGGGYQLKLSLSLLCIPNGNLNAVVDIHSELIN